jgi:probable HAF family extracellular repeat protein
VTLHPSAAAGWDFIGFDGACVGGTCTLAIGADAAAVANFIQNAVELSVSVSGGGSVVSTPAAIDCPGVCSAKFAPGAAVTLKASAASGSRFDGFTGACAGASCSLRLAASASVSASFALIPTFKVRVVTAGNGVGRVTSSPAGIDCPGSCAATFPVDTALTLSAAADALSKSAGFDGSCSGAACSFKLAGDAAVVAKFDLRRYAALDLSVPGGGWWTTSAGISRTGTLVAGTWGGGAQQMFVWDGAIHDSGIATPWVGGVNENGVVVGSSNTESGWHAFRWKAGFVTDLGTLGGATSNALGVNRDGIVAGWSMRADGVQRAVAWTPQGIVDLGSLVDGGCSYATGINSAGEIVGSTCTAAAGVRAARFRGPGAIDDLGSFGGTTIALAINDSGLIVGYSYLPNGAYHGFVYTDGKMIDAGTLPGMPYSQLAALNGEGLAVGYATDGKGVSHAVIYGGGRMVDLNSVVDATPYTLGSASGIDEAGNIVVTSTNGSMRALLLCPQ